MKIRILTEGKGRKVVVTGDEDEEIASFTADDLDDAHRKIKEARADGFWTVMPKPREKKPVAKRASVPGPKKRAATGKGK